MDNIQVRYRFQISKTVNDKLKVLAIMHDQKFAEYITTVLTQHVTDSAHLVKEMFAND